MKIIEILPELDIGGVERHVIDLTSELARRGHQILVVRRGQNAETARPTGKTPPPQRS